MGNECSSIACDTYECIYSYCIYYIYFQTKYDTEKDLDSYKYNPVLNYDLDPIKNQSDLENQSDSFKKGPYRETDVELNEIIISPEHPNKNFNNLITPAMRSRLDYNTKKGNIPISVIIDPSYMNRKNQLSL